MNKVNKILLASIIIIIPIILISIIIFFNLDFNISQNKSDLIEIPISDSLFTIIAPSSKIFYDLDTKIAQYEQAEFYLKPDYLEIYNKIGFLDQKSNAVVIYPTFTESAYSENGFYDYYNSNCNETCLTVSIQDNFEGEYASSRAAHRILDLLGYEQLTDIDVDKNPEILSKYDKVILLHNEYVTQNEFDAITSHPNVIYLYPNSLYAKVDMNYETNSITLVRGHGYPEIQITNGFDWIFDNTRPYEFDNQCQNWEFTQILNGFMLNCYPEYVVFKDQKLLETIKNL